MGTAGFLVQDKFKPILYIRSDSGKYHPEIGKKRPLVEVVNWTPNFPQARQAPSISQLFFYCALKISCPLKKSL